MYNLIHLLFDTKVILNTFYCGLHLKQSKHLFVINLTSYLINLIKYCILHFFAVTNEKVLLNTYRIYFVSSISCQEWIFRTEAKIDYNCLQVEVRENFQ